MNWHLGALTAFDLLRTQGKPEVIDPSWPLREMAEAV